MITWDAGSDDEPPSPSPPPSQQLSLSPSDDLPGSSSQHGNTNTSREQTAEGFGGHLDSVDIDEHELQLAGSDEDVLRDSIDDIAIAAPSIDADAETDEDTVEQDMNSEDDTDLFIVSSSVSSILNLTVS